MPTGGATAPTGSFSGGRGLPATVIPRSVVHASFCIRRSARSFPRVLRLFLQRLRLPGADDVEDDRAPGVGQGAAEGGGVVDALAVDPADDVSGFQAQRFAA